MVKRSEKNPADLRSKGDAVFGRIDLSFFPDSAIPTEEYDIVIVGAGAGGLVSAIEATDLEEISSSWRRWTGPSAMPYTPAGPSARGRRGFRRPRGSKNDLETFYNDLMEVSSIGATRSSPACTRRNRLRRSPGWPTVVGGAVQEYRGGDPPIRGSTH